MRLFRSGETVSSGEQTALDGEDPYKWSSDNLPSSHSKEVWEKCLRSRSRRVLDTLLRQVDGVKLFRQVDEGLRTQYQNVFFELTGCDCNQSSMVFKYCVFIEMEDEICLPLDFGLIGKGLVYVNFQAHDKVSGDVDIEINIKVDDDPNDLIEPTVIKFLEESIHLILREKIMRIAKYEVGPRIHPSEIFEDHLKNLPRWIKFLRRVFRCDARDDSDKECSDLEGFPGSGVLAGEYLDVEVFLDGQKPSCEKTIEFVSEDLEKDSADSDSKVIEQADSTRSYSARSTSAGSDGHSTSSEGDPPTKSDSDSDTKGSSMRSGP